ncbi:HCP-like protein [Neocallimastix californiae]|uniref:HCP-like protein n=1 Tax=Neocallimastix californiae TaxID=1754190 RepID=A0A1Y2BGK0_9FUNG|nr:HCP-like protein [Neocallimastix californiae]|eukprot:ORY33943.1 HCP-like protein [Neocallimastix californiae]
MKFLSISKLFILFAGTLNFSYGLTESSNDQQIDSDSIYKSTLEILLSFPNTTYTDTRSFLQKKLQRYPGALSYLQLDKKNKKQDDTIEIILNRNKLESLPVIEEKDSIKDKRIKVHRTLEYLGIKQKQSQALLKLADIYFYGYYGYPQNIDKALQYYKFLAEEFGSPQAQQKIGFIYSIGLGSTQRDQAKALLYLSFAAMNNDIPAQISLGYRYLFGIGTERNCDESIWYYRKIADEMVKIQQSGPPLGRLLPPPKISVYEEDGGIFGKGASNAIGRPIDEAKGGSDISASELLTLYQYIEENEKFNPSKQVLIALNYYQGNPPVKKDFKRALKIFKVAARHLPEDILKSDNIKITDKDLESFQTTNNIKSASKAAAFIGQMYWRGEGVEANDIEARKWYQRSAKLGYSAAINALGVMYQYGYGQLKQDEDMAIKYYIAASNKGNPDAQTNLGNILLESTHVENKVSAFNLFQQASKAGNIVASFKLANIYQSGEIIPEQCVFAASLYKTIAERASYYDHLFEEAKLDLRQKNYNAALLKYLILSEQGYEMAQSNAAYLIDEGLASTDSLFYNNQNPYALALIYWKRSANQMNPDSRVKVGDYYFYGLGTDDFQEEEVTDSDESSSEDNVDDDTDVDDDDIVGYPGEENKEEEEDEDIRSKENNKKKKKKKRNQRKDLYLAKRYYDRSLELNAYAAFPIKIALAKLNFKVQIHNLKCRLAHREDDYIIFKEDKEGTDNKINFDEGDDETSKSINERIKLSFNGQHGQNERELSIKDRIMKSFELNDDSKRILASFILKFLIGYGLGYVTYAIFHYFQHGRLPEVRFSVLVVYIFIFSAVIGTVLSSFQEEIQMRLRAARAH